MFKIDPSRPSSQHQFAVFFVFFFWLPEKVKPAFPQHVPTLHHPRAKAREVPALHGLDRSLHTRKSHPKNLNFKKKRLNVYVLSANRRPKGIRTQPRNFFYGDAPCVVVKIQIFCKKSCQKSIFWPKNMDPGQVASWSPENDTATIFFWVIIILGYYYKAIARVRIFRSTVFWKIA